MTIEKYSIQIQGYTLELARKSIELDAAIKALDDSEESTKKYLELKEEKDRNDKYLGHWIAQDLKNLPF